MDEKNSLSQDDKVQEFLKLLENNDMKSEKDSISFLLNYIDSMNKQFEEVTNELTLVKNELNHIQDKQVKNVTIKAVNNVSNKVNEAKTQFLVIKDHVKNTIHEAVDSYKTHGKTVLVNAVDKLHVINGLEKVKNGLMSCLNTFEKDFNQMTKIREETHQIKGHFKNIGRVLLRKDTKSIPKKDMEKGPLAYVQKGLFSVMAKVEAMTVHTDKAIGHLNTTIEKNKNRQSVKKSLKEFKHNKVNSKDMKVKGISR